MINIVNKELCCGCSVCEDQCPQQCIRMVNDEEGFRYPRIDHDKCVNCGMCNKVCPIENSLSDRMAPIASYAAWNKDDNIRIMSTSGGVFTALAQIVIQMNGVVIGAQYDKDYNVDHSVTDSQEGVEKLRQSKYVQSETSGIFIAAKRALGTGKPVLFCGTPCHTEALVKFLKGKPDNLILCDFICRGIISPLVYKQYLGYLEGRYKSKIKQVHFKNKTYGWHRFSTKITFENGKEYIQDRYHDSYMLLYLRENISLRPSCYQCRFKGVSRCSDITLGDFWGIQKKYSGLDNDHGTSAVMVHTELGNSLLMEAQKYLEIHNVDLMDIIKGNDCILHSPSCLKDRKQFYNSLESKGYAFIKKKYAGTLGEDIKRAILQGAKNVKKARKIGIK